MLIPPVTSAPSTKKSTEPGIESGIESAIESGSQRGRQPASEVSSPEGAVALQVAGVASTMSTVAPGPTVVPSPLFVPSPSPASATRPIDSPRPTPAPGLPINWAAIERRCRAILPARGVVAARQELLAYDCDGLTLHRW